MSTQTITAEDLEKFSTSHRRQIVFYLRQLINERERISVVFNEGSESVLTVLLDVDETEGMLIFDWGGSETANRKLLQSDRNYFVCAPHGVKNHFMTGPVYETSYKKRPAFSTRLPVQFTRLQRRDYFRLVLPMTRRPPCIVPREDGPAMTLSGVDISIGGIAAELPGGKLPFEIGQVLPRVRIELKAIGTLEVDLLVKNSCEVERGGKVWGRIGCHFVKLSHGMEKQLQRFITDVQREERARMGG